MENAEGSRYTDLAKKRLVTFIVFSLGILTLILIYKTYTIFLILFAAILFACFLLGVSRWVSRKTKIPEKWSLWIFVLLIFLALAGTNYFIGYRVAEQFSTLSDSLQTAVTDVEQKIRNTSLGERLLKSASGSGSFEPKQLVQKGFTFFSSFLGILANILVFIALSLFIAGSPDTYVKGTVMLFPRKNHKAVNSLLTDLSKTLFHWLTGRLLDMAALGVLTGLGLWILGIPLAFSLGILAAILSFIPNIGPFLAAVPPVLLAFSLGMDKVLYAIILFVVIQLMESYFLTPFIQKKAVEVPPVLLLVAQLILAVLAGILGLLVATPLVAVLLIIVKKIYIEKILDEKLES